MLKYINYKEVLFQKKYISEENMVVIKKYNILLKLLLFELIEHRHINYSQWIYYLESIYIHIDFIIKLKKKDRLPNMYRLIDGISKKAADINIDLIEILNEEIKVSSLLLDEYKNNILFNNIKNM